MRHVATNGAAWSVGLSVTTVSPAKAAEPIVILVGMFTSVAPRNHVLDYTDTDTDIY